MDRTSAEALVAPNIVRIGPFAAVPHEACRRLLGDAGLARLKADRVRCLGPTPGTVYPWNVADLLQLLDELAVVAGTTPDGGTTMPDLEMSVHEFDLPVAPCDFATAYALAAELTGETVKVVSVDWVRDTDCPAQTEGKMQVRLLHLVERPMVVVPVPELLRAAHAADHVLGSLLACRSGATDELLQEVRDALQAAIRDAG